MKQVALFLVVLILLITFSAEIIYSAEYTIIMRNGGSFEAATYSIEGENIKIILAEPKDAIIDIRRDDVEKIIKNKEETSKKSEIVVEKRLELCDTVNCTSNYYYSCCKNVNKWTELMKPACDKAEKQESYVDVCKRYKKEVSFWENQCPSCYIGSSCCGWHF
jgi:hypothetical protein